LKPKTVDKFAEEEQRKNPEGGKCGQQNRGCPGPDPGGSIELTTQVKAPGE